MLFRFTSILFLLLAASAGAQTISGLSGPFEPGGVLTISGSGFGSKTNPAPVTWDNMESGDFSEDWQSTGGLSISTESRYPGSNFSGTLNMAGSRGEAGNHAYFTGNNDILGERWFAQFWFKLDENFDWGTSSYGGDDQNLANVKVFRMWNPGNINENFHVNVHGYSGSGRIQYNTEHVNNPQGGFFGNHWEWTKGVWHCLQVEYEESSVGGNDGVLRVWRDGELKVEDTDIMTRENHSQLKRPYIVGMYDAWNDSDSDRDDVYLDDAYIDNTWARVEVGDDQDYGSCTHREIQIPTAWSDDSITVTANPGSFSGGEDLYLFVVEASGQVSDGFLITAGGGNAAPGIPGQPVRDE